MDLQTMRTYVLTHEDLEAEDVDETLLDGWAAEGYIRIVRLVATYPFYEGSTQLTTEASTSAYTVDMKRIDAIYGDAGHLDPIGHNEASRKYRASNAAEGRPTKWSKYGGQVELWPIPDQVYTFTVEGHREPVVWPPLAGAPGSQPDLPEDFHRLVVSWMLHRALLQQDDGERAAAELSHFQSLLGELVTDEIRADIAQPLIFGGRRTARGYPPGSMPFDYDTIPT